jgi:hypothetical protein
MARVVPRREGFDQRRVSLTGPDAPAQEGADARETVADRVVSGSLAVACAPGEDINLGELRGVVAAGPRKQVGEFGDVLATGVVVAVAARELCDEGVCRR